VFLSLRLDPPVVRRSVPPVEVVRGVLRGGLVVGRVEEVLNEGLRRRRRREKKKQEEERDGRREKGEGKELIWGTCHLRTGIAGRI